MKETICAKNIIAIDVILNLLDLQDKVAPTAAGNVFFNILSFKQ